MSKPETGQERMDIMEGGEEGTGSDGWSIFRGRHGQQLDRRFTKRTRADLDSSNEEDWYEAVVDGDKVAGDVSKIKCEMNNVLNDPDRKVSKKVSGEIADFVGDFDSIIVKLISRNAYLEGVLDAKEKENHKLMELLSSGERGRQTFAETVKGIGVPLITGTLKRNMPKKKFTAFVKPSVESVNVSADDVKVTFLKTVDPVKQRIHIDSLKRLKSGAIPVETETQEDLEKIMRNKSVKEVGLQVNPSNLRLPRVILYDVPTDLTEEMGKEVIYEQNTDIFTDLPRESFSNEVKLLFKTGPRNKDTTHWVLEVSPTVRNVLRRHERIYIESYRCRVNDFVAVSRCYKCQGFGHIAKSCKSEKETCGKCAEEGHNIRNCKKPEQYHRCAVCKRLGKSDDHAANGNCPQYRVIVEVNKERTNYG